MENTFFSVESFLRSLHATKPPYECPKCKKIYKSYSGIEYHLINFDHTAEQPPPKRTKFSKKKRTAKFTTFSPSPVAFSIPTTRETLTWAEAQRMVEVESEGRIYRLNINEKLDIISDSDLDKDDDTSSNNDVISDKDEPNDSKTSDTTKLCIEKNNASSCNNSLDSVNSKDLKNVKLSVPENVNENIPAEGMNVVSPSKLPEPSFRVIADYDKEKADAPPRSSSYYRYIERTLEELEEEIEYDMDEEDAVWLELMNESRIKDGLSKVTHNQLETLMDRFEKESYFEQAKSSLSTLSSQPNIDDDAVCCICNNGESETLNVILFCDMCNLAVHQECYGVPYIPEGQWLCRRCLQSPSCPVDCCLCPSRNGAFKQTDDGRWAHVVCALWIPEIGFANTVFMEPVDDLKKIPPARWRLTCYICKQRGVGACIQCHRTNCYTAFHVTCAQQAGLFMKMEPVHETGRNGVRITVKKEAYCDLHAPHDDDAPKQTKVNGLLVFDTQEKASNDTMKKTRKILSEKRHELPKISFPFIPRDKIPSIGRQLTIQKKSSFIQRLLSYWTLKRQARNGVPLLRRLQSQTHAHKSRDPDADSQQHQLIQQVKYWYRLRHDLERARLLIELLGKREKLKRESIRISQIVSEFRLTPFLILLRRILNKMEEIDSAKVFAAPVKIQEAPDYYKLIEQPMDLSTMAAKIEAHKYKALEDFEEDFNLLIRNCTYYNEKDTVYYKQAIKLRDQGGIVLRAAKRQIEKSGYDLESGMLLPKLPRRKSTDQRIDHGARRDVQQEKLDMANNARKTKKIRSEISALNRKLLQQTTLTSNFAGKENLSGAGRVTSRRFSANDAESSSSVTGNGTLAISDSGFKISPQIGPVSSKRARLGRKRLWSERPTIAHCSEPKRKKALFERSESCPASDDTDDRLSLLLPSPIRRCSVTVSSLEVESFQNAAKIAALSGDDHLKSSSSIIQPSPSTTNSVSRRSAVLFKKKPRVRPHNLNLSGTSQAADTTLLSQQLSLPHSAKLPKPTFPRNTKRIRSVSGQSTFEPLEGRVASLKDVLLNGLSPSDDENVFREKLSPKSPDDVKYNQEKCESAESTSDTDSSSSNNTVNGTRPNDEKWKIAKKKRSYSCTAGFTNDYPYDMTESETSSDERSSLTLGENTDFMAPASAGLFYRKQSFPSITEGELDGDDDLPHLSPLKLVWAKCRGYPPYPGLLIDPKMPRSGYCYNGVPIPVPPLEVLHVGDKRIENGNHHIYLVLFFDAKRTWQWLPRSKLAPLGDNEESDQAKLSEGRRPTIRKNVEAAYKRALLHHSRVTGVIPDSDDEPSSVEHADASLDS